jgi:hypothetical protein
MTAKKETISDDEIWFFFKDILRNDSAIVRFEKVDGTVRTMKCTLQPEAYDEYEFKGGDNPDDDVLPVWDLEKDAWRSIRKGTLIEVTVLDK